MFVPVQILKRLKIENISLEEVEHRENTVFERNPNKIGQKLKTIGQNLCLAHMKNIKFRKNSVFSRQKCFFFSTNF